MSRPATPSPRQMQPTDVNSIGDALMSEPGPAVATPQRITTPSSSSRGRLPVHFPSRFARGEPGRVPLHKRGTSRTYERLEDLLKEAGYKETKIYSPEVDRTERHGEGQTSGRAVSGRGGVGAVMDFLTGLIPGTNKTEEHESSSNEDLVNHKSPPPSPLAGKRPRKTSLRPIAIEDLSDTPSSSSSPKPRYRATYSQSASSEHSPVMHSSASDSLRAHVQISAAQGYLRHIASTPNISKADKSHAGQKAGPSKLHFMTAEEPPLPSNWFDSVTRAVLGSSSTAAHVGGPTHATRQSCSERAAKENRPATSCAIQNKVRPVTGDLRSETAPGAVNTVRVVCRSAPASRSSSRLGDRLAASVADKGKTRESSRPKYSKSRSAHSDVPTLASTRLENDSWNLQWLDGERVQTVVSDDELSDDDDDGELDLARILVPPKRQKSIRSLRQHLHRSESARALRGELLRPLDPWMPHDDDDDGKKSASARIKSRRGSTEDGRDEDRTAWDLPGHQQSSLKKRRTLPGTWSNRSLGRS